MNTGISGDNATHFTDLKPKSEEEKEKIRFDEWEDETQHLQKAFAFGHDQIDQDLLDFWQSCNQKTELQFPRMFSRQI
jgi:hypothetical protein